MANVLNCVETFNRTEFFNGVIRVKYHFCARCVNSVEHSDRIRSYSIVLGVLIAVGVVVVLNM